MFDAGMIDNLIEAGWHVIESDFDPRAFKNWKMRAFECVHSLMGPDHPYTQYFNAFVIRPQCTDLLAGEGILNAVRDKAGSKSSDGPSDPRACCANDLMSDKSADAA